VDESDVCRPRTPLFVAGVLLTGLHALVGWFIGMVLVGFSLGRFAAIRSWVEAQDLRLLDLALSVAGLVGTYYLLLSSVQLVACAGAWFGSRAWTWALALTAVLALPSSGPVSLVLALVTVKGAAQVLDQSRPFPTD
jgi:hypothetical protein